MRGLRHAPPAEVEGARDGTVSNTSMGGTTNVNVVETAPLSARRVPAYASAGRRLLAAAAVLHVLLALGLHWAGRAQVAPGLIDRDGIMDTFAHDSYEYREGAVRLAEVLKRDGVAAWAAVGQPVHVRLISLQFALVGPLTGYGPLSAEPFNLICYLAVVGLTLLLGREVGGARAGLLAALVVALWPTFLLHTLQLLKDPLFIAGTLALVLCVTTWLTRVYGPASAAVASALVGVTILLLLLIRLNFAVVIFALVLLGAALLVVRQIKERRRLVWNMAAPASILAAGALLFLLVLFLKPPAAQSFKHYPSDGRGWPKTEVTEGERVTAVVAYLPRAVSVYGEEPSRAARLMAAADKAAQRLGTVRYRFNAFYTEAGSSVDRDVRFYNIGSVLLYLPRAFAIGWWAPFPNTWAGAGRRVGSVGKLLSGAETLVIYAFELLALAAVFLPPRRLAAWLLFALTTFGVTALGLVVPNIGALYRFRYTFWVLLIVLGAKGLENVWALDARGRRAALACAALACLLAGSFAHASNARQNTETAVVTTNAPADERAGGLGFTLVNLTGATLRAVNVSPSESAGWEENVLDGVELADGESIEIRFSPEERGAAWDIRVKGLAALFAEWKGLRLRGVSRITMRLDEMGERVVVAEID
ncbi:MAG TPA: hypothetical protein VF297_27575 [Pyrinomonadaceae bacterium]